MVKLQLSLVTPRNLVHNWKIDTKLTGPNQPNFYRNLIQQKTIRQKKI